MLSQRDPRGNLTEFTYDELNRKTAHIQHKAGGNLTVSYDLYDAEGNLKQMTDAKGQVFTYGYDELNRLTLIDHPLDATTPFMAIDKVETSYDANNNVATVTETKQINGGGTQTDVTTNTWDDFDRLDATTQRGMTVDYAYDNNGNRTMVSTINGSTTLQLRPPQPPGNRRGRRHRDYDLHYTPDGLTDTVSYPNGASADYDYWPSNRVQSITHTDSAAATISSFSYQYDANGNRTQQVELQGTGSEQVPVPETTNYPTTPSTGWRASPSATGRAPRPPITPSRVTTAKPKRSPSIAWSPVDKTYAYDETNWLDSVTDAVSGETITYSYDNNGNTLLKTVTGTGSEPVPVPMVTTFSYDVANRLVQTEQGATLLGQYDYNASGMRVRHYGSERGDVEYYYDDGAVLEEYVAGAGGGLLAHYRYGDRLLSLDTGTETQYYHHDALGSTVNLTDGAGLTKVRYTLDPWGHIRSQLGSSVNRQIFTGQEHDENTGLIYFGARYYDPDTGRFISQDSYLGEVGTPPSLHRYLYAYSNPIVWIDLYGFASKESLPKYDYGERDDGGWQPNLFRMRFNGGGDALSGFVEVAADTFEFTSETLDGAVDVMVTGVGGTKDVALSIVTLPLLAAERIGGFRKPGSFLPYAEKHLDVSFESYARRWRFAREAGLASSFLMLGQEVPMVGNFVPGARGNMNANTTGIIGGGINADNEDESNKRDLYTQMALPKDINYEYAINDRDSAIRVGLSLFFGYRAKGLEAAEQIVNVVEKGSTIEAYGHSGGGSRFSVASKYTGIYDVGFSKLVTDQGPSLGLYNNVNSLQATYSTGLKDPTSLLGAVLSIGYWSTGNNKHLYAGDRNKDFVNMILGDEHRQNGNPEKMDPKSGVFGNEFSRINYEFLIRP